MQLQIDTMSWFDSCVNNTFAQGSLFGHQLKYSHDRQPCQVTFLRTSQVLFTFVCALFDEWQELFDKVSDCLDIDATKAADNYLAEIIAFAFNKWYNHFQQGSGRAKGGIEF